MDLKSSEKDTHGLRHINSSFIEVSGLYIRIRAQQIYLQKIVLMVPFNRSHQSVSG